uniref:RING-CH-type domain-containing protein n=1 Tax=Aegilops tauschii subsp. strangulata TaxID=200361 RepID=A0A453DLU0_AEGTS
MGVEEEQDVQQPDAGAGKPDAAKPPPLENNQQKPSDPRTSTCSTDKDDGLALCRVCHCVEPDLRGESALGFLGIVPPSPDPKDSANAPTFLEFISPEGEIFKCATDIESGPLHPQDDIVTLGCSCKNELALAHYACALKWFISHGSTVCEICSDIATNVRPEDFNTVLASLKDYEALRERTSTGDLSYLHYRAEASVDPAALAAVRRQRLCEISSWFNPHNAHFVFSQSQRHSNNEEVPVSPSNNSADYSVSAWGPAHGGPSVGSTGAFVAIALAFVILAWFVAPHVGKRAAAIILHMLLGGLCSLTIIISLRFVFPRIQFGSMRYWGILFVSWFLVFGVWASRTRTIRRNS